MDRTKLEKQLKKEINRYLGIPYFINTPQNPRQMLAVQVAKGDWRQIKKYTQKIAQEKGLNFNNFTPLQRYRFQKKHHIGIDCSGLAYHLLDFLHQTKYHQSIRSHLIGTQGKTGPRRLSAHLLTSPPNALLIANRQKIQAGDLIRTKKGKHLLFIYKKTKTKIYCIQSSRWGRGVKLDSLAKLPPSATLHRLKCLTSLPPIPGT